MKDERLVKRPSRNRSLSCQNPKRENPTQKKPCRKRNKNLRTRTRTRSTKPRTRASPRAIRLHGRRPTQAARHPNDARPGRFSPGPSFVYAASVSLRPRKSEEHTSELQSLMRISYAVFCLKKKTTKKEHTNKY